LGNTVSPDEMVERYGADATRLYSLFAAPPDRDLDWQETGIEGIQRFLGRVYRFYLATVKPEHPEWRQPVPTNLMGPAREIQRRLHRTIKRITEDFDSRWHFNTSIAGLMELTNQLVSDVSRWLEGGERQKKLTAEPTPKGMPNIPVALIAQVQRSMALLLAPFAPFIAHELWEMIGEKDSLLKAPWPKYEAALIEEEQKERPIQVDGKLRSVITMPADTSEPQIEERILADEKIKRAIAGRHILEVKHAKNISNVVTVTAGTVSLMPNTSEPKK
jgi:leucyl-tRNA synthetase